MATKQAQNLVIWQQHQEVANLNFGLASTLILASAQWPIIRWLASIWR
jgi:hypothetical protein